MPGPAWGGGNKKSAMTIKQLLWESYFIFLIIFAWIFAGAAFRQAELVLTDLSLPSV